MKNSLFYPIRTVLRYRENHIPSRCMPRKARNRKKYISVRSLPSLSPSFISDYLKSPPNFPPRPLYRTPYTFPVAANAPLDLENAVIFRSLPVTVTFPPDIVRIICVGENAFTLSTPDMVIFFCCSTVRVCDVLLCVSADFFSALFSCILYYMKPFPAI